MTDAAQTALFPSAPPAFVPAVLSPCERFRYELRREVEPGAWARGGPLVLFCGANPSKADARKNDHTIRKEIGFTRRWLFDGVPFAGFIKLNMLAWRSTDADKVPRNYASIGNPENERHIEAALNEPRVAIVVAAWGDCLIDHPFLSGEVERFSLLAKQANREVMCFGRTKSGAPKHPLMLGYSTPLERWSTR